MQKLTQRLAEAILPLLGFYSWNWTWYFILLFYILDVAAKEITLHLQANKIYKTQGGEKNHETWKSVGIKSAMIAVFTLFLLHVLQYWKYPEFSFTNEIESFLGHKEIGIPQGLILLPLIFLNVWMHYKQNFLKTNQYVKMRMNAMWQEHLNYRLFVLTFAAIGLGIGTVFGIKDYVLLWAAVLLPFIYWQFFRKTA
jgi:hypothetical protein